MRNPRNPSTPREWQEAVDAAAALRAIADCEMYGLLEGGPNINVGRCDKILERGRARGVRPSKDVTELAVEYVAAFNASFEGRQPGGYRKPTGNAEA